MRALPRPAELSARALLAAILVLGLLHGLQRTIVAPLMPGFAKTVRVIAPDFDILDGTVAQNGPALTALFQANLAHPVEFAGHTLYPLGWSPAQPNGVFEVRLPLGGLLQYSALMFIIALAWPAARPQEFVLRFALCLPLMAMLLFMEAPFTVAAELWTVVRDKVAPDQFNGWLLWSRFLMGGGGLLLATLCGLTVVGVARRLFDKSVQLPRQLPGSH